ncbi:bifunctional MaoC family dehydratase N-terminal/OB-fold nucleic acid binding domain-containing protein [Streptomyces sp. NPDC059010]|uniref:bifunctional MaoC family dehydratase N-terminal/OB-fold nucleic acid binding domain-containing protein n=1 Tax=Streptomyces sp. NPDC059010 TaxID=3346695 RepID=UPI003693D638
MEAGEEFEARLVAYEARLKAYEGRSAAVARAGRDPVNAPMIRHWCEAMGDTNPAYLGPDAIAPPTMLQAWTMAGLSGHTTRTHAYDELLGLLDQAGYTSVVATDCEQEYLCPLRPGDEITFDSMIESVSERKTTKLGTGYFVTTRMDIHVGPDLAGTHRFRILKYAPIRRSGQPDRQQKPSERGVDGRQQQPSERGVDGRQQQSSEQHADGRRQKPSGQDADGRPQKPARPLPVVNRDNAGFWEGVQRHRLLIQRCTGCGTLRHPWLPGCNACGGLDWDTVEASGEGTVYSYVVMHHPPFPAFDPPYAVALVELAEGVRMIGNVVGAPYDKVRIGLPVRLEFQEYEEELVLPVWCAEEGAAQEGTAQEGTAREGTHERR